MAALEQQRRDAEEIAVKRRNARLVVPDDTGHPDTAASQGIRHDTTVFHLPSTIEPVPGLFENVARLREAGKAGRALDVVLQVLRDDPRSADTYRYALMLCSARTGRSQSAESITEEQLRDRCSIRSARSAHPAGTRGSLSTNLSTPRPNSPPSNPIGLQCQLCRYTLCCNCLTSDRRCPQMGCAGVLGIPVLATGRPQLGKIEYVVSVMERDTLQPQELFDLVYSNSPDIGLAGAGFVVSTGFPGVDDIFGYFVVTNLEPEGRLRPNALSRTRLVSVHHPVMGVVRFYLVEATSDHN